MFDWGLTAKGGNDVIARGVPGNQHVPLEEFISNQSKYFSLIDEHAKKKNTAAKLVQITPIPSCPTQVSTIVKEAVTSIWTNKRAAKYARSVIDWGKRKKDEVERSVKEGKTTGITEVHVINMWDPFVEASRLSEEDVMASLGISSTKQQPSGPQDSKDNPSDSQQTFAETADNEVTTALQRFLLHS